MLSPRLKSPLMGRFEGGRVRYVWFSDSTILKLQVAIAHLRVEDRVHDNPLSQSSVYLVTRQYSKH